MWNNKKGQNAISNEYLRDMVAVRFVASVMVEEIYYGSALRVERETQDNKSANKNEMGLLEGKYEVENEMDVVNN